MIMTQFYSRLTTKMSIIPPAICVRLGQFSHDENEVVVRYFTKNVAIYLSIRKMIGAQRIRARGNCADKRHDTDRLVTANFLK